MSLLRKLSYYPEKVTCYGLVFILTPCYFLFEILIVRPVIVREYHLSRIEHILHIICSTFCFVNIVSNMILCMFTDTSLKRSAGSKSYCDLCKLSRPVDAWHCRTCDICVLKRDHHCFFFSRCIGLYNRRYYVIYLFYMFVSMVYSMYYNCLFALAKIDFTVAMLFSVNRVNRFLIGWLFYEPTIVDVCIMFMVFNGGLVVWSGVLLTIHSRNMLRGVTAREGKHSKGVEWRVMKRNVEEALGCKWYWAILWPLADSPLPNKCY